jgi:hypothetical protein
MTPAEEEEGVARPTAVAAMAGVAQWRPAEEEESGSAAASSA